MLSLYERLFKYRVSDKQTPLENYLTEAFCDLLNRMERENAQAQADILHKLFAYTGPTPVHFQTQYTIHLPDKTSKIPDLVGCCSGKVVLLLEIKVGAGFTCKAPGSAVASDDAEDSPPKVRAKARTNINLWPMANGLRKTAHLMRSSFS